MKNFYIVAVLILFAISSHGATCSYMFLNNNVDASSLDLEVRVKGVDTVYIRVNAISYLTATTKLTIPSSVLLKLTFFTTGTSTAFYTYDNAVFNDNSNTLALLIGTSTSKNYNQSTSFNGSSSGGKIKYGFINSTPGLQEIDLKARNVVTMEDNFVYTDRSFAGTNEIDATIIILDVTPYNESSGLFAYNLNASTLGGQYIFLFTAGTSSSLTMYMLQTDGSVTQLTSATPLVTGIQKSQFQPLSVYPNPTKELLNIQNDFSGECLIELRSLTGIKVLSVNTIADSQGISLNVADLSEGLYVCVIKTADKIYTGKVNIKH
jgi:hypothetical protein